MKIIRLQANNIKKLTAIEISPEGNIITLAGNNGAGKSSILDSIVYALGGTDNVCGLRTVAELATQQDYQVWIEDSRSADPAAVIIEDGHVKV